MTNDQNMSDVYENDLYHLRMTREANEEEKEYQRELAIEAAIDGLNVRMLGLMPDGNRRKDCTSAEKAGFAHAWKMEAAALDKLWDEAAATLDHPNRYAKDPPDVVFHALFCILLSLAGDKGADREDVLALLLSTALTLHGA